MLFIDGLYYLCFIVLIGIALFVLKKDPLSWLNRYFVLLAFSILGWLVTLHFFNRQADTAALLALGRANFSFAALIVFFNYLFVPEIAKKKAQWTIPLAIETAALVAVTQFTGLIDHSEHIQNGEHITTFGPLFLFYAAHIVIYLLAALYFIFSGNRKSSAKYQGQLAIIGFGVFVMASIAVTTNIVLPFGFHIFALQEVGALATIAFLAGVAYAIVARHLFDIRIIIKRTVVYTGLLVFALGTYSMIIFFFTSLLGGNGTTAFDFKSFVVNLLAAGLIAIGYEPLRVWLTNRTDSFLFKKEYEEQAVLKELGKKLNDVVALDEALEMMMQTIVKVMHLKHALTFVFQQSDNGEVAIKRIKQIGYSSMTHLYLNERDFTIQYFTSHPGVATYENLKREVEAEKRKFNYVAGKQTKELPKETSELIRQHAVKQSVLKKLESLGAALAIPLHLNERPIGLILLSDKLSGDSYSPEDLTLLDTIGSQAISSIQKAKLYEGDQMKSEFVSIASHELLTPVSAMEGYLSMILDEHMGKVDEQARTYLTKVYTSSKRLSVLIKDLLSVSRIESGRLKVEEQQLDITKVINDTIDQLRFLAQEKKLKLHFEKPEKDMPPVWADSDRTMQVMVNLVSNAIKYTPSGEVTIQAKHGLQPVPHVEVTVTDTGLGMTKSAQSHLFEKFYRVSTPETEGIIGTGLGLYITKSIVERMGGNMTVKSAPGKGSTFSFTLPTFKVESSQR